LTDVKEQRLIVEDPDGNFRHSSPMQGIGHGNDVKEEPPSACSQK